MPFMGHVENTEIQSMDYFEYWGRAGRNPGWFWGAPWRYVGRFGRGMQVMGVPMGLPLGMFYEEKVALAVARIRFLGAKLP